MNSWRLEVKSKFSAELEFSFAIAMSISYLNSKPAEVVDSVFDEAPAVATTDLESALPAESDSGASGLEAELPPAVESATEEVKDTSEKAASEIEEKTEDVKQTSSADKTEENKKEQDDQ